MFTETNVFMCVFVSFSSHKAATQSHKFILHVGKRSECDENIMQSLTSVIFYLDSSSSSSSSSSSGRVFRPINYKLQITAVQIFFFQQFDSHRVVLGYLMSFILLT
jgi:hypothetical protein